MASGQALIDLCKTHLVETMRSLPECASDGPGLGNKALEEAADFALHLPAKDNWFTWSLLSASFFMAASIPARPRSRAPSTA
jgi:hypothetical protein